MSASHSKVCSEHRSCLRRPLTLWSVCCAGVTFRCHKALLVRHCKVWQIAHELDPKAIEWPLPDTFSWSADELKLFLEVLYTPSIVETKLTAAQWKSLLLLSNYFDAQALIPAAESALCKVWTDAFGSAPAAAAAFAFNTASTRCSTSPSRSVCARAPGKALR
jgi:hypothetical protein